MPRPIWRPKTPILAPVSASRHRLSFPPIGPIAGLPSRSIACCQSPALRVGAVTPAPDTAAGPTTGLGLLAGLLQAVIASVADKAARIAIIVVRIGVFCGRLSYGNVGQFQRR